MRVLRERAFLVGLVCSAGALYVRFALANPTFNDLAGIQAFVSLGVAPVAAEVPKPGQRNFGGGVNGCHSFAPRQVFARNVLLG